MAHNRRCRITVLKCGLDQELAERFDPQSRPCRLFHEGQEFVLDQNGMGGYWHLMCGSFCSEAWASISNYIDTILQGGAFETPDGTNYKIACCPHGIHPVVFKIELVDEAASS